MYIKKLLKETKNDGLTPAYVFDVDQFKKTINMIHNILGDIPLTYSVKANPFLLECIPPEINHVEVCSQGELCACKHYDIPGAKIIYSGVNKEYSDSEEAILYGVDICTVESLLQLKIIQNIAQKHNVKQKILIRLTSGNQFGLSEEDLFKIITEQSNYTNILICGIHYYSGTLKKKKQIEKDIISLDTFLSTAQEKYGFQPSLVEYGPGLGCSYFEGDYREYENEMMDYLTTIIDSFAKKYQVGIEMGRFMTASCGKYITKVMDIKNNDDTNYVILDGGIHQLRYHGQKMAMQNPRIEVISANDDICERRDSVHYTLCGSLCTVADVLINDIEIHRLKIGDYIVFDNCGAYSVSDANLAFLSRKMPIVGLWSENDGFRIVRNHVESFKLNCGDQL